MAAFTENEMMADLAAADAAGDTKLAQHIAGQIKSLRGTKLPEEKPGLLRRAAGAVGDFAAGMLPPSAGPLGATANLLSGGRYGKVAPEYGGLYQPPLPPVQQQAGESRSGALIRGSFDPSLTEATLPLAMLASVPGGGKGRPLLRKSTEAQLLESQGVKGLTVGQAIENPQGSALAALEAASTKNPLGLGPQRAAAQRSWEVSEIAKSRKPGEAPLPADVPGAQAEAYQRFGPEYDAIRNIPVTPEAIASLPRAASMPRRGVDARTTAGVKAEVENALTVLGMKPKAPHAHGAGTPAAEGGLVDPFGRPIPPPPEPPPTATVGDLLKVRENIREQGRIAQKSQDFDRVRLLDGAEDVVSEAIEGALPGSARAALRDADRRYATLMRTERAPPVGQTEFTPGQLLRSSERASGRRAFKQGEAFGQESASAAQQVFSEMPFTGGRAAVLSSIPGLGYGAAPLMRLLNTPTGKRLLFETNFRRPGLPPPAVTAQTLEQALAEALTKRGVQVSPAAADEEGRR